MEVSDDRSSVTLNGIGRVPAHMYRLDHVSEAADHPNVHGIARDTLLGLRRHAPGVLVVRPSSRQDDIGEKPVRREHCAQCDRDVPAFIA